LSQFIVDTHLPGITINRIADMHGSNAMNEVFFDNVRINQKYRIGPENRGWYQIAATWILSAAAPTA